MNQLLKNKFYILFKILLRNNFKLYFVKYLFLKFKFVTLIIIHFIVSYVIEIYFMYHAACKCHYYQLMTMSVLITLLIKHY